MNTRNKIRKVIFILIGVVLLISKKYYDGPYQEFVNSYLGNVSVSFSVYFLISKNESMGKRNKIITALIALAIVELFEITNGFGIMSNVFDLYDLIANLIGVSIALGLDLFISKPKSKISSH